MGVLQLCFSEILLLYLILGIFDVKHWQECLQEEDKDVKLWTMFGVKAFGILGVLYTVKLKFFYLCLEGKSLR